MSSRSPSKLENKSKGLERRFGGSRRVVVYPAVVVKRARRDVSRNPRIKEPNVLEWNNYQRYFQRTPTELKKNFVHLKKLVIRSKGSRIYAERVLNRDGVPSLSMHETGRIKNPFFWESFHRMMNWMLSQRIFLYDFNPKNFYVKWVSRDECIPVLVDYKIIGVSTHPWQPWLHIPFFGAQKMRRRMMRFEEKMKGD